MTVGQAIAAADAAKINVTDAGVKLAWLSELDGRIYFELIKPFGGAGTFGGYDGSTPEDTELLVPYPYDALYVAYLEQELCRAGGETAKYNNARLIFNEKYSAFSRWYARTHGQSTPNIKFPVRRY